MLLPTGEPRDNLTDELDVVSSLLEHGCSGFTDAHWWRGDQFPPLKIALTQNGRMNSLEDIDVDERESSAFIAPFKLRTASRGDDPR